MPAPMKLRQYSLLGAKKPNEYTLLGKDNKLRVKLDWVKERGSKPLDLKPKGYEYDPWRRLQKRLTHRFPGEAQNRVTQSALSRFVDKLAEGKGIPLTSSGSTRVNVTTSGDPKKKDFLINVKVNYWSR